MVVSLLNSRRFFPMVLLSVWFFVSGCDKIHACSMTPSNYEIYIEKSIYITGGTWHLPQSLPNRIACNQDDIVNQSCFISNTRDTTLPDEIINDGDIEDDDVSLSHLLLNHGSFFNYNSQAGVMSLFRLKLILSTFLPGVGVFFVNRRI